MIVRISSEGQYEINDDEVSALNGLDNEAVAACDAGDEQRFHDVFSQLVAEVRERGKLLPDDELVGSDIILPPPDVSIEEAKEAFQGEGLIPS
jgi:hypothetical protein